MPMTGTLSSGGRPNSDLFGVAARHSGHGVRVVDAGLHPVHVAPELQFLRHEDTRAVQPRFVENRGIPAALVLEIVNGIDDAQRAPTE